uniref:Transcription elongation factor A N-terminal and central domain-containing protein-like protein n=1 Tax=Callorhinchus milii TaxID=7868 RepID=V9KYM1_CALMI
MTDLKEVTRKTHQIEKLISENCIQDIKYLLSDFGEIPVTERILQESDLIKAVYKVLKNCPNADVKKKARDLLSTWKKLYTSSSFQEKCRIQDGEKINDNLLRKSNEIAEEILDPGVLGTSSALRNTTQQLTSESTQIEMGAAVTQCLDPNENLQGSHSEKQILTDKVLVLTDCDPTPENHGGFIVQAVRSKCVELLLHALTDSELANKARLEMCRGFAKEVEESIYALYNKNEKKYKTCIRSKISNLKNPKNPHLLQKVLSGKVTAKMFAEMSAMDMASEELKQLRASYTISAVQDHQLPYEMEGIKTNKIRCKRCENFNCTVTAIARGTLFIPAWVRNGNPDEQMMTFVICNECGEKWYNSGWISI